MTHNADCVAFAWIGQAITSCDDCGRPAWDHDGMSRLKKDAGPFGCNDDAWEVRPWADDVVASWLKQGLIDRQRAIALLSVHNDGKECAD